MKSLKLLPLLLLSLPLFAQQTIDYSNALSVIPWTVRSTLPGVCTYGQRLTLTTGTIGSNNYVCGLTNNWVVDGGSSSGGTGGVYCVGTGTNSITCPGNPVPASYTTGMTVSLLAGGSNTGPVTLQIAGLPSPKAVQLNGAALTANVMVSGNSYSLYYDGTAFQLTGTLASVSVGGSTTFTTSQTMASGDANTTKAFSCAGTCNYTFLTLPPTPQMSTIIANCSTTQNVVLDVNTNSALLLLTGGTTGTPSNITIGPASASGACQSWGITSGLDNVFVISKLGTTGATGATGATGPTGSAGAGNNALCPDATGSTTTYTCPTPSPTVTTLTGLIITFIPQTTNTGASTVAVAGLGVKNLVAQNCSTALAASALTAGTAYLFAYNGTVFCQASSTGTAGGGISTSQGTYSALPGTCAVGDLYFFTDSWYQGRCSTTNIWSKFFEGKLITPPADLTLTSTLQAGVAVTTTGGYEHMTFGAGGTTTLSYRTWASSSPPFTSYVYVTPPIRNDNGTFNSSWVGMMDSSNNQVAFITGINDGGGFTNSYFAIRGAIAGTVGATIASLGVSYNVTPWPLIIALQVDATRVRFGLSNDNGSTYFEYYNELCGTHFASCAAINRLFYGGYNSSANGDTVTFVGVR